MIQQLDLPITGMHCGACVNRVTVALKKLPGVEVEDVQVGSAKLRFDPGQNSRRSIGEAIEKIGFHVAK